MVQLLAQDFGADGEHVDLREYPLPLCDGDCAYSDPNVAKLSEKIAAARVIIVGVPVYNFYANAAAKNLIELTGRAWENKIVGFLCAAGGHSSYMSIMSLANSLMLDFRCLIIPRFVYATSDDFKGAGVPKAELAKRLQQLAAAARGVRNSP
jgi:FMN reductase